jgi:hypothetical protein
MDDLERPVDQFQVLPNPSQKDGRTGSWSWYPQQARVGMVKEGSNTVLTYAGTSLAAWTGATLAFLGGNGADREVEIVWKRAHHGGDALHRALHGLGVLHVEGEDLEAFAANVGFEKGGKVVDRAIGEADLGDGGVLQQVVGAGGTLHSGAEYEHAHLCDSVGR